mgnify:CR=1 FL=1
MLVETLDKSEDLNHSIKCRFSAIRKSGISLQMTEIKVFFVEKEEEIPQWYTAIGKNSQIMVKIGLKRAQKRAKIDKIGKIAKIAKTDKNTCFRYYLF